MVRTLRLILGRIHATGERNLKKVLHAAVQTYNSSIHTTTNFTPYEAEKPENQDDVLLNIEKKHHKFLAKYYRNYERLNNKFKVGDIVHKKLPKDPFHKEAEDLFSPEQYRVASIVPSGPMVRYKLQQQGSNVIIPDSWSLSQLLKS